MSESSSAWWQTYRRVRLLLRSARRSTYRNSDMPEGVTPHMHAATISVRPLAAEELRLIEQSLRQGRQDKHRQRLERQQRGRAVYLIAWYATLAVGHLLLKWTTDESTTTIPVLLRWPELEDFFVAPAYRAQGIGARLLEEAEGLARQAGYA